MSIKTLVYAYVLGGITFIPLVILGLIFITIYTSVPVGDPDIDKDAGDKREREVTSEQAEHAEEASASDVNDLPQTRKGWLTVRRTFEESGFDGSYVGLVRSYLDSRSKDPKRSRPKDMWYVALKGKVLYLYEDESMTECEAAVQLSGHDVLIYPEGLADGELFARRNAICLRPKLPLSEKEMLSVTKEMKLSEENIDQKVEEMGGGPKKKEREREKLTEAEKAREQALDASTPWFIFVKPNVQMEDWYFALVHASENEANSPTLASLQPVFQPSDMAHLVATLDEQPDVIPMRWLNALIGRIFFSYYRTKTLESYIIGRLMKKLGKVKRPGFLTDVVIKEVSVGNRAPTFSKPMLKELTKEGDASLEVKVHYKGEIRITIEATATINLGVRFKSYTVKLVLAAVLRELDGNLLVKVKRPPSNRIWYAFTQMPNMLLDVEPIVSDRQITWSMILSTIEARLKEIILESVVMPNMDDIAFFESSQYQHRGGIWADASRPEEPAATGGESASEEGDNVSVASMPAPDPVSSLSADSDTSFQRSHSTGEVISDTKLPFSTHENEKSVDSSISMSLDSSSTVTSLTERQVSSSSQKSAVSSFDAGSHSDDETESQRGRTTEMDSSVAPRPSRSAPAQRDNTQTDPEDDAELNQYLSAHSSRRSTSQHSHSSSSRSVSSSYTNSTPEPSSDITPQTPTRQSRSNTNASISSSPTTSFFSTLKSRAGDKQALSNTAKEAMRKWGVNVNWGSLRRDGTGPAAADDGASEDAGGGRGTDTSRWANHKSKLSYADVRAAVTERKDRERVSPGIDQSRQASEPIAIPRSQTTGENRDTSHSPNFPDAGGSSSGEQSSGDRNERPKLMAPSMSRTTTSLQTSQQMDGNSNESRGSSSHSTEDDPEPLPSLIHTQPVQARTMTIPGIHASHRGEVMSMGYAPPSTSPTPSENKGRTPAIQSVYRLLKSPMLSAQQQQAGDLPTQNDLTEQNSDAPQDQRTATTSLAPSRPVPPPLPPRSTPTLPVARSPDPSPLIAPKGETFGSPESDRPLPITLDNQDMSSQRTSEGSADASSPVLERPTKPPLPPRRTQTSQV